MFSKKKIALGGIIGAVSEHLTFDVHYQTASLEIALGASSQHIIVEDEHVRQTKAIDFLKETDLVVQPSFP